MPPIVGVPTFSKWVCGPSSRIRCPHPQIGTDRIASGVPSSVTARPTAPATRIGITRAPPPPARGRPRATLAQHDVAGPGGGGHVRRLLRRVVGRDVGGVHPLADRGARDRARRVPDRHEAIDPHPRGELADAIVLLGEIGPSSAISPSTATSRPSPRSTAPCEGRRRRLGVRVVGVVHDPDAGGVVNVSIRQRETVPGRARRPRRRATPSSRPTAAAASAFDTMCSPGTASAHVGLVPPATSRNAARPSRSERHALGADVRLGPRPERHDPTGRAVRVARSRPDRPRSGSRRRPASSASTAPPTPRRSTPTIRRSPCARRRRSSRRRCPGGRSREELHVPGPARAHLGDEHLGVLGAPSSVIGSPTSLLNDPGLAWTRARVATDRVARGPSSRSCRSPP